jgi:8-oxo-dGTP pyrophosphatase MutT (NUDIX family)
MSAHTPQQSDALERAIKHFRAAWEIAHLALPRGAALATASRPPPEFIPWFCGHIVLGYMSPPRARLLAAHLTPTCLQAHRLEWDAGHWSTPQRSAALQDALLSLRALGHLPGWRNEPFAFYAEGCETALFKAERAGFYFLGMCSDAVHVNGFTADGRMWIARRSASKHVDPGLLDNLSAGGVAAGETIETCLQRELYEEAGIRLRAEHLLRFRGTTHVGRVRDGGWHVERLHVYNLLLQVNEQPCNHDGEVQEFLLLTAAELADLVDAKKSTPDAAAAIVRGLGLPLRA